MHISEPEYLLRARVCENISHFLDLCEAAEEVTRLEIPMTATNEATRLRRSLTTSLKSVQNLHRDVFNAELDY